MLANWIKQATATTGTGTITLGSAPDGYITFDTIYNDGDIIYYSVEDDNNREIGRGVYTASGTTITRTTVLETLVNGTYDNTSPTAITLSGSAIVMVAGVSQTVETPYFLTTHTDSNDAAIIIPDNWNEIGGAFTVTADRLVMLPIRTSYLGEIGSLSCIIETLDATAAGRMAVYTIDLATGRAGTKLAETNEFTFDATGVKIVSLTSNIEITPGWYYIGVVSATSTPVLDSVRAVSNMSAMLTMNTSGNIRSYSHLAITGWSPGGLATNYSGSTWSLTTWADAPVIYMVKS